MSCCILGTDERKCNAENISVFLVKSGPYTRIRYSFAVQRRELKFSGSRKVSKVFANAIKGREGVGGEIEAI